MSEPKQTRTITRPVEVTVRVQVFTCCKCGQDAPDPTPEFLAVARDQPLEPDLRGWYEVKPAQELVKTDAKGNMYRVEALYLCPGCAPDEVKHG